MGDNDEHPRFALRKEPTENLTICIPSRLRERLDAFQERHPMRPSLGRICELAIEAYLLMADNSPEAWADYDRRKLYCPPGKQ